jgi:hypothetical protein
MKIPRKKTSTGLVSISMGFQLIKYISAFKTPPAQPPCDLQASGKSFRNYQRLSPIVHLPGEGKLSGRLSWPTVSTIGQTIRSPIMAYRLNYRLYYYYATAHYQVNYQATYSLLPTRDPRELS